VSLSRHERFTSWLSRWVDNSVTDDDIQSCMNLLLGTGDASSGLVPCDTHRQTVAASQHTEPYHEYYRYHVTYHYDTDTHTS